MGDHPPQLDDGLSTLLNSRGVLLSKGLSSFLRGEFSNLIQVVTLLVAVKSFRITAILCAARCAWYPLQNLHTRLKVGVINSRKGVEGA